MEVAYKLEEDEEHLVPADPVAFYFNRIKGLELTGPYLYFFSPEAKRTYLTELCKAYDILYAELMTKDMSWYLKQEVEQWYEFNRDFIRLGDTKQVNADLEEMLRRFDLF